MYTVFVCLVCCRVVCLKIGKGYQSTNNTGYLPANLLFLTQQRLQALYITANVIVLLMTLTAPTAEPDPIVPATDANTTAPAAAAETVLATV